MNYQRGRVRTGFYLNKRTTDGVETLQKKTLQRPFPVDSLAVEGRTESRNSREKSLRQTFTQRLIPREIQYYTNLDTTRT